VIGALSDFRQQVPKESPYALAIILGQCGNYLGYAVATEEGLRRVAQQYAAKGYRYQAWEWEEFDNLERLGTWLRWANPDDGWHYEDFPERFEVARLLASLVERRAFGEDAEELEEFCTEALAGLQSDPDWLAVVAAYQLAVGVTSGNDPRIFCGQRREPTATGWSGNSGRSTGAPKSCLARFERPAESRPSQRLKQPGRDPGFPSVNVLVGGAGSLACRSMPQ
jgi:hypothetical protein